MIAVALFAAAALVVGPAATASAAPAAAAGIVITPSVTVTVTVTVKSKTVPNVVGKTVSGASKALSKVGLKHKYLAPKGSFVVLAKNWTVTKQSPKAGAIVKAGTKVKLTVVKTATISSSSASSGQITTPAGPTLTVSQQQAVIAAKGYLSLGSGFSYQGLIDQLSSAYGNGFSVADATTAVNSLNVDYNAQAVLAAKGYLALGGFSHATLVEQLSSSAGSQFTAAQAEYAATQVGL